MGLRYTKTIFQHRLDDMKFVNAGPTITGLVTTVDSLAEDYPQIGDDESYELTIPETSGSATLHAKTVFGALRGIHPRTFKKLRKYMLLTGLETFSQVVTFDYDSQTYVVAEAPWQIMDAPRFPHRG